MKHETSFLAVNEIWRELLVVTSKSEIPDYPNGIITDTGEHYETIYYTDGVFRSLCGGRAAHQLVSHPIQGGAGTSG